MPGRGFTVKKHWDNPVEHEMPADARVPAEMRIGNVLVAPATVLAPMAGVTDTVFRRFIRHASVFSTGNEGTRDREQGNKGPRELGNGGTSSEIEAIEAEVSNTPVGLRVVDDGVHLGGWAVADAGIEAQAVPDLLRR